MEENTPQKSSKPSQLDKWRMVHLAAELGYIIALPLVALGLLGKWLDGRFDTEPLFVLLGIILAITATTVWLTKRLKEYIK